MRYILVIISALIAPLLTAQNENLVNDALEAYKLGEYSKAKYCINKSLEKPKNQEDAKVWNFRGHIYKQIFKEKISDNKDEARNEAVLSFKKSSELNTSSKFHTDNNKAIEYLAATFYNDAVEGVLKLRYKQSEDPVAYFQAFKKLKLYLNAEAVVRNEELAFLKMLAQSYEKIHTKHDSEDRESILKAISYYGKALEVDPDDYEANFNLAIIHYNEGARLIGKISYKTGIDELIDIQNTCVEYFRLSLPFMEKAEVIRPNRIESLKGLMFINRALNNFDTYLEYKVRLDKILKN